MKRFRLALVALAMMGLSCTASADSGPLLKRIDVKSYEGYLQVTPGNSSAPNFDINFIRPAYDFQPTTAGAMVGLIQLMGKVSAISYKFDSACKGELITRIGLQQFGGDNVGYLKTTWTTDPFTDKVSLNSTEFQARGGSVEDVNLTNITGRLTKGQSITIKLPAELSYVPGDILVMEDLRYTSNSEQFSACQVKVSQD
jgi:hypothetical protein